MKKKIPRLLGEFRLSFPTFSHLPKLFREFKAEGFKNLNARQKLDRISSSLLGLIQKQKAPCFLLPAVLDFIQRVNRLRVTEPYYIAHFELWLNQFSRLSPEENAEVRAKIMGKWIPRDAYQEIFPIGMGKIYPGSHYVTAHGSPDLDTTVASFWGWTDAFCARVAENLHIWNVPDGPPSANVEIGILFHQILGKNVFHALAKTRTSLALSAFDLLTQKGVIRQDIQAPLSSDYERMRAVVLVDEQGYFLGDWRDFDVEAVRHVIVLLNGCLRWYQSALHVMLISLFSKEALASKDLPAFLTSIFQMRIEECDPAKEFTPTLRGYVDGYLKKVLGVRQGLACTFEEFAHAMKALSLFEFAEFIDFLKSLQKSPLFDPAGFLIENRPRLFNMLEKVIKALESAVLEVRRYVDRLDVALKIKTEVFRHPMHSVSMRAEVDEIRNQMRSYRHLTVTLPDEHGRSHPLGVIYSEEIHKPILGTVSLRDFCNREETKIPSYFEVISAIDHHKSQLQTSHAGMFLVADAQSSNVLCAEQAFRMQDQFPTGQDDKRGLQAQLKELGKKAHTPANNRLLQKVLKRLQALDRRGSHFIDAGRLYLEYLHYVFAILDDTDLLAKVSKRDVLCMAELLNRLKSLTAGREVEIIALDDLPEDAHFAAAAAQRILQHRDTYSLYKKAYLAKEKSVEKNILACAKGKQHNLFTDTKEQNGCARVGQTKLFARNVSPYAHAAPRIRTRWVKGVTEAWLKKPEADLHMHMISTIAGAEEVYKGKQGVYAHQDELWIWIPFTESSIEHLQHFLNLFRASPQVVDNDFTLALTRSKHREYNQIFQESFLPIAQKVLLEKETLPIAILRYNAGTINSRKGMISPYLPKLVE